MLTLCTFPTHIESHLGKKQPQAKIPIAFLFSHIHFNNVTSHALFYGGHLVMRSKRCAVQNQGITLTKSAMIGIWLGKFWCLERKSLMGGSRLWEMVAHGGLTEYYCRTRLKGLPCLNSYIENLFYFSCSYLIRPCSAHEEQNSTDPEIMVPKSDSEDLHHTSL